MENKMQIEKLIDKFREGTLSREELAFLLEYLKEQEPQHELLNFYQSEWDESLKTPSGINSQEVYRELVSRIGKSGLVVSESGDEIGPATMETEILRLTGFWRRALQYAAIFIAAFGLSWLVHSFFTGKKIHKDLVQSQKIEVPYGSKSKVELPDGSVVTLNAGSSLKYSAWDFSSEKRSVFLEGEAFFDVKKNPERPFYVNTRGIKLKVLGTTFNVKAYPEENTEEATLVTGTVEIYTSTDEYERGEPLLLKPNQKAVFIRSKQQLMKEENNQSTIHVIEPVKLRSLKEQSEAKTEQTISWKDNKLVFDNESFTSLVVKIERWYNVQIKVNYPELNQARFSGKFDKETLEQVMKALVTVTPFKYDIKQNLITITRK